MSGNVQKDQSVSHVICLCSSHFQPDFYLNSGLHGLKVGMYCCQSASLQQTDLFCSMPLVSTGCNLYESWR